MASRRVEQMKQLAAFAGCRRAELEVLAQNADEVTAAAGETLVAQGEANRTWWVLLEGEVAVDISGHRRARLGSGDFFGEISMELRSPATATVTALTPVRALVMSHTQYRALRSSDRARGRVLGRMAARLAADRCADSIAPSYRPKGAEQG